MTGSHLYHDQSVVIIPQCRDFTKLFLCDDLAWEVIFLQRIFYKKSFHDLKIRSHELLYPLFSFDDKTSRLFASRFLMKGLDMCDF